MCAFLFDANILINSFRDRHPKDIFPFFWEKLESLQIESSWNLIDRIHQEIMAGNDALKEWTKRVCTHSLSVQDANVISSYALIIRDVQANPRYTDAAKQGYANSADAWLIAYAHATGKTIVSFEVPDPNIRRKVKIPDVCKAFKISCINLNAYFRNTGICFNNFL